MSSAVPNPNAFGLNMANANVAHPMGGNQRAVNPIVGNMNVANLNPGGLNAGNPNPANPNQAHLNVHHPNGANQNLGNPGMGNGNAGNLNAGNLNAHLNAMNPAPGHPHPNAAPNNQNMGNLNVANLNAANIHVPNPNMAAANVLRNQSIGQLVSSVNHLTSGIRRLDSIRYMRPEDIPDSARVPANPVWNHRLYTEDAMMHGAIDNGVPKLIVGFQTQQANGRLHVRIVVAAVSNGILEFFRTTRDENFQTYADPPSDVRVAIQNVNFFANFRGYHRNTLTYCLRVGLDMPQMSWRQIVHERGALATQDMNGLTFCNGYFPDGHTLSDRLYSRADGQFEYRPWYVDQTGALISRNYVARAPWTYRPPVLQQANQAPLVNQPPHFQAWIHGLQHPLAPHANQAGQHNNQFGHIHQPPMAQPYPVFPLNNHAPRGVAQAQGQGEHPILLQQNDPAVPPMHDEESDDASVHTPNTDEDDSDMIDEDNAAMLDGDMELTDEEWDLRVAGMDPEEWAAMRRDPRWIPLIPARLLIPNVDRDDGMLDEAEVSSDEDEELTDEEWDQRVADMDPEEWEAMKRDPRWIPLIPARLLNPNQAARDNNMHDGEQELSEEGWVQWIAEMGAEEWEAMKRDPRWIPLIPARLLLPTLNNDDADMYDWDEDMSDEAWNDWVADMGDEEWQAMKRDPRWIPHIPAHLLA